jgi:hypothetical protein
VISSSDDTEARERSGKLRRQSRRGCTGKSVFGPSPVRVKTDILPSITQPRDGTVLTGAAEELVYSRPA